MSNSPFTPGYGRSPLVFGGHERELRELARVFSEYDFGENQSVLVSGLRGAGKTSMLTELRKLAAHNGWLTASEDASPGMLSRLSDSHVPRIVNSLARSERKVLSGLNIWQFGADFHIVDSSRPVTPLLRNDLLAIARATENRGLLITVDEVAPGRTDKTEIKKLALEISHAISEGANVMVVYAGVKLDLDELVRQEHLTFLRRSRRIDFRRLSPDETRHVLVETARTGGREIEQDAVDLMLSVSQGYPYLVQLLGDYAWRHNVEAATLTLPDAHAAQAQGVQMIQDRVISRAYDDLSDTDRLFVRALAEVGDRAKMADIIQNLQSLTARSGRNSSVVTPQYVHQYKRRLIDSGYVESHGRGYVRFSLPYLGDYLRAMQHELEDDEAAQGPSDWDSFPPPPL